MDTFAEERDNFYKEEQQERESAQEDNNLEE